MANQPTIIPYLSYESGAQALDFLESAFGFRRNFAQIGEDGVLVHAEMTTGNGVILVGSAALPKGSPGIYVVVEDVQAHYDRAVAAGATVVFEPEETEWGTERYRVTDIEGHEWTFGTYSPSTEPAAWS